jgi:hypothetical protein
MSSSQPQLLPHATRDLARSEVTAINEIVAAPFAKALTPAAQ